MPTTAKFYIGATVALGFALLTGSLIWFRQFPDATLFVACLSLACIASTMKVRLPGLHGTISVNFVFILMGIAQLSLTETLIMAAAATLVQSLWRTKTQPRMVQVLFNTSTVVISTALAYAAAHLVRGEVQLWAALAPAATVFFIMNTGMVSLILALISKTSLVAKWRQCHLWTFPYYMVGAAIAAAVSISSHAMGWRVSLLVLPIVFLIYSYFNIYVSAQKDDQSIT
jgi:hypothetical protein